MKPIKATLEPNTHNAGACTVVLYFEDEPTTSDVVEACKNDLGHLPLGVDTDDEFFKFEEHPTTVSDRGSLRRFEVYPTG